ncbi:transporter [Janthinobacterium svalbardensis]|uniref:Transporter n=1 Tax=Janthinobacterium svalbardensis TaxID=368607 RepID=A0A290WYI6_9BURK|nr:TolC family protein [Janthinobacterium svalbardensis]ATD61937.1 transporter [Janthinobacterium svalbardensis]
MFSKFATHSFASSHFKKASFNAVIAACAFIPVFSYAESASLTLDQALQMATLASASNKAAQASVLASTEASAKANQLPDPTLKVGLDNLPVTGRDKFSTTADFMTMRRIGIEQQWVSSDKRKARLDRSKRAIEAEEGGYLENVAKVREEAGSAWISVLYAQRAAGLYKLIEKEMAEDLNAAQASHRSAKGTASDVLQSQLELVQGKDDTRKAEQASRAARIGLSRWLRVPVDSVADETPTLVTHVADIPLADLEKYHPIVLLARRAVSLADADTNVAAKERSPDWSFEAGFAQRGSQYSNMISIGISIPLTVNRPQRQDRDIAEKSAMGTKARLQYEDAVLEQQTQIQMLSADLESLKERISELKSTLLPPSRQQVDLAVAAYRSGAGTLTSVFKAKRASLEKQLLINELEKEAALTWAKLELHVIPHDMPSSTRNVQ